jgi:hypothetical protein
MPTILDCLSSSEVDKRRVNRRGGFTSPGAPAGINGSGQVHLDWAGDTPNEFYHYNVYRHIGTDYRLSDEALLGGSTGVGSISGHVTYDDSAPSTPQLYLYTVTSVFNVGTSLVPVWVESAASLSAAVVVGDGNGDVFGISGERDAIHGIRGRSLCRH